MKRRTVLAGGLGIPPACAAAPLSLLSRDGIGLIADGSTDNHARLQQAIDELARTGGVLRLPPGRFRISKPVRLRSGVSLIGSGRHYEVTAIGNRFTGTWIVGAPIELYSIQNCVLSDLGIDGEEKPHTVGLSFGSDNNPSCKSHVVERISVFGAELAIRWGLGNSRSSWEQCDDISLRDISIYSCNNGFRFDAANGSDYSRIERVSFAELRGTAFDMRSAGFLTIANCAAGMTANAVMFRITGHSPDPIRIIGCQSEPGGRFLVAEGPNDQATIILEGNVVNIPIEAKGILRFMSRANYFNSSLRLDGYVRWRSYDDVWDAPGDRHTPQVLNGAQFRASIFPDARGSVGKYVLQGTRIECADPRKIEIVTEPGIYCPPFVPKGEYEIDNYFSYNDDAYHVVEPGKAGTVLKGERTGRVGVIRVGAAAQTIPIRLPGA